MDYAVIGMGAVGGYYGCRLAQAGKRVHFLMRSDYAYVKEHGYEVDSYLGSFHLDQLHLYDRAEQMPPCDVVFVALKTTANHLLPQLLPPLLKPDTLVVLVQNGIGVEADVQQMFPCLQLAAGVAFINCAKSGPGRLIHRGYGHITLANYSCRDPRRLEQVAADFNQSGVRAQLGDYNETRWRKAILNLATNGVTVLLNARCDQLIAHPASRQLVYDLMVEGVHAAQACGVTALTEDFADQLLASTARTVFATSMKYDFDHHQPMEVQYLYTRPLQEAAAHGCQLPKLSLVEQQLRYLNQSLDR